MELPRLALAGALVLAACGAGASTVTPGLPGELIQSCLADLRELSDTEGHSEAHNFNLEKRCPRLARRLASTGEFDAAGAFEVEATSIEGLRDLQSFASDYRRGRPAAEVFSPDFDGLDALLADVLIEKDTDEGVWARFLRWLEQYVKDGESPGFKRFLEWLDGLDAPPWLGDVLLKVSIVLIILLALIVIGNEIRLMGLIRPGRRPQGVKISPAVPTQKERRRALTLDELRGLPPRELAAAVLEVVTSAFAARGWLSSSESLTNGELVRQVDQRQSRLAGPFSSLVNGIETIIYGDRLPDDETRRRIFETADELVKRAGGSAATASGASS